MTNIERPDHDPGLVVWKPRTLGSSTYGSNQVLGYLIGGPLHGTKMFRFSIEVDVGLSARDRFDPPLPSWVRKVVEWHDQVFHFVYIGFCYVNTVAEQDTGSRPRDDELIAAYRMRAEDLGAYPPRKWIFLEIIRRRGERPSDNSDLNRPELPSTHCFDCGSQVPIADVWTKKADPNYALCEGCFRSAETGGRAREGII